MSLQIYDYYFNGARNTGEKFEKQHIFKLLPLQVGCFACDFVTFLFCILF